MREEKTMQFTTWMEAHKGRKIIITDRVRNGNRLIRKYNIEQKKDSVFTTCMTLSQIAEELLQAWNAYQQSEEPVTVLDSKGCVYLLDEIIKKNQYHFVPKESFCINTTETILKSMNQIRMNQPKASYETAQEQKVVELKHLISVYEACLRNDKKVYDYCTLLKKGTEILEASDKEMLYQYLTWTKGCQSFSVPGGGDERQQQGEDLQTAQQHGEGQDDLGEVGVLGKAAGGAHHIEAGADVVEAGHSGGEMGFKAEGIKGDEKEGGHDTQGIQCKIGGCAGLSLFIHNPSLVAHHGNGAGVDHAADFRADHLGQDHHAADLQAAAGGAGAGAHEHQQQQNGLGKLRPEVKVGGGIARGGDDGRYLEGGVAQTFAPGRIHGGDVDGDGQYAGAHDAQIRPKLRAA